MPDPVRQQEAAAIMNEDACLLDEEQRRIVEETVAEHCRIRGWRLHAVNCRTNHLHVVVCASRHPDEVRRQLKAWCTRRLKELAQRRGIAVREHWWAERGSKRWINDPDGLEAAVTYVRDGQDRH
jgi:REP element-mobilizing transposase RayT